METSNVNENIWYRLNLKLFPLLLHHHSDLVIHVFSSSPFNPFCFIHIVFLLFSLVKNWISLKDISPCTFGNKWLPQQCNAVSIFTCSGWLCVCVCVSIRVAFILCLAHWKRDRMAGKEKGAVLSSDLSTCVCHWVNRSCCHEWKTTCGLLCGIEFQVLSALLISSQKAERAVNTPSHCGFSWDVIDRISNSSV